VSVADRKAMGEEKHEVKPKYDVATDIARRFLNI
jgi:hypothetical protein